MSKGEGLKIGIKFTEDLVGDISPPISTFETQSGDWLVNGTYVGTVVDIKDGNISTYWQSRSTVNYVQISKPNTKLLGIKVYKGSSYRPSNFILRTSIDGITYSDVKSGSFVASTGWETIMFDEPVISDYFRINFGYTTRLYLYELVLIVEGYDNEVVNDFVITGKEYQYVNGPLIDKRYKVINIEKHPTEPKSILITLDWWGKINNAEGQITIAYDVTKGSLTGAGGAVESFEVEFTPTDLVQTPNPGITEYINTDLDLGITLVELIFTKGYNTEYINTELTLSIELMNIDDINP